MAAVEALQGQALEALDRLRFAAGDLTGLEHHDAGPGRARRAAIAAAMPARPPPTTATSTSAPMTRDRLAQRRDCLDGRLGQNAVAQVDDAARVACAALHLFEQRAGLLAHGFDQGRTAARVEVALQHVRPGNARASANGVRQSSEKPSAPLSPSIGKRWWPPRTNRSALRPFLWSASVMRRSAGQRELLVLAPGEHGRPRLSNS